MNKEYQDQKATVNPVFYKARLLMHSINHNLKLMFPAQEKASQIHTILCVQTIYTTAVFLSVMQALGSIEGYCSCDLYLKRNTTM